MERDKTEQQQQGQDDSSSEPMRSIQHALDGPQSCTHDVIGVVVKISLDAVNSKAQVLISDKSIQENAYARVSLVGTDTVTSSLAEVSVGDVLCFHGFKVTKHNSSKLPLVADFHSSWQEPEAGWTRVHKRGEQISCVDEATADRIRDLVEWFSITSFYDSIPALPCRRRRLNELHTPGITSHAVARVVSIDTAATTPPGSRRRKRWLPLKKQQTMIAVLSDGSEVIPFVDCAAHEAALRGAIQSGKQVLVTNVVTCAAEERSNRDAVLRPTDTTSVTPMLDSRSGSKQQAASNTRETQCLSLTQEVPGPAARIQTLSSPLRDVYIDELGISLGDGKHFVSPNGFVSTIIDTSGRSPQYREATLTLDGMVVKADASMMQTLCGSIDPETLLNHTRLRTHVTDLMRGLLDEKLTLTWTLERNGDTHYVTKCFLPRL